MEGSRLTVTLGEDLRSKEILNRVCDIVLMELVYLVISKDMCMVWTRFRKES